jgi:hypothetical protein
MDNKTFDDFVSRQLEGETATASVDWAKERDAWLSHLNDLYSKIEFYLGKYLSSGQIQYRYRSIKLNEEHIGSYTARQMVLRIGRQEVIFVPIGTLLIGSKGRVDIVGPLGRAEMLLVDSKASGPRSLVHVTVGVGGKLHAAPSGLPTDIQWEWRIVTRPPERRFIEITQQSLFQLIMEVANG